MGCMVERYPDLLERVVVLDVETGGLDPTVHALVEVALVCGDEHYSARVLDPTGMMDPAALAYRGVDARTVLEGARSSQAVALEVQRWVADAESRLGRLTLAGHNVGFDVAFLSRLFTRGRIRLTPPRVLASTYQSVDTHSILWSWVQRGVLPESCRRLDGALTHYGIRVEGRHTALGDARATQALLRRLLEAP